MFIKMKTIVIILLSFFLLIPLYFSIIKAFGVLGIFIISFLVVFCFIGCIINLLKNKERTIKKIKEFWEYLIIIPLLKIGDSISTYFFVSKKGIETEANVITRFLYSYLGNYTFILTALIFSLILLIILLNFPDTKQGIKIIIGVYVITILINLVFGVIL